MERDVRRDRLLRRIAAQDVRFAVLVAAAGYGKSTLARQYAGGFPHARVCDFVTCKTIAEVTARIGDVTDAIPADGETSVLVFENAEVLADIHGAEALLGRTLAALPAQIRVCICSRTPLAIPYLTFSLPHEVAVVDEAMLAFDDNEIRRFSEIAHIDVAELMHVTRGWPLCVRLITRLAESGATDALTDLASVEFGSLYEYLVANVIERLPEIMRSVAIALAATGGAGDDDLKRLFPSEAGAALEAVRSSPFVISQNGIWVLHPLVAASIAQRYPAETQRCLRMCAELALIDDPLHAASLYVRLCDWECAADALDDAAPVIAKRGRTAHFDVLLRSLPREVLLTRPRLFAVAANGPVYSNDESRLHDALCVYGTLKPDADRVTHAMVCAAIAMSLSNLGRHMEALDYVRGIASAGDDVLAMHHEYLFAVISARVGNYPLAMQCWPRLQTLARNTPALLAAAAAEVAARSAETGANYVEAHRWTSFALAHAKRSGDVAVYASILAQALFFAWLRGDEDDFAVHATQFAQLHRTHALSATRILLQPVAGSASDAEPGDAPHRIRAYAHLISLAYARGDAQHRIGLQAIEAADRAGEPYLQCIARVAAALADADAARRLLLEAKVHAERCSAPALVNAVAELQAGGSSEIFSPLAQRVADRSSTHAYRVCVLTSSVHKGGIELRPTVRERELLLYLAFCDRVVPMDELAEAYAPDAGSDDASRLIRVTVSRMRKKYGENLIVSAGGGYALGPDVESPWRLLQARIERSLADPSATPRDVFALRLDLQAIEAALSSRRPAYEWGTQLDAALERNADDIRFILSHQRPPEQEPAQLGASTSAAEPDPETKAKLREVARIRTAAIAWHERDRDPDLLLTGGQLRDAVAAVETGIVPDDLREFVTFSQRREAKREAVRRRERLRTAAAVISSLCAALLIIFFAYRQYAQAQRTVQIQQETALENELRADGFAAASKRCAAARDGCMSAMETWLNRTIPFVSNITYPEFRYNYEVPMVRVSHCAIAFEKRYIERSSGRVLIDDNESGALNAVWWINWGMRGFDGGDNGIFGERGLQKFPTVIIASYRPFKRNIAGRRTSYNYIYFTVNDSPVANDLVRNFKLYAVLCNNTHVPSYEL